MKYIRKASSRVEIIEYTVKDERGKIFDISAEDFERDYMPEGNATPQPHTPVPVVRQEPARAIEPAPQQPQAQARADDRPDDYSTVVCADCGQPYKKATGSKTGMFCSHCTQVKCPVCKEAVISLSEAREFNACLVCRTRQR